MVTATSTRSPVRFKDGERRRGRCSSRAALPSVLAWFRSLEIQPRYPSSWWMIRLNGVWSRTTRVEPSRLRALRYFDFAIRVETNIRY